MTDIDMTVTGDALVELRILNNRLSGKRQEHSAVDSQVAAFEARRAQIRVDVMRDEQELNAKLLQLAAARGVTDITGWSFSFETGEFVRRA